MVRISSAPPDETSESDHRRGPPCAVNDDLVSLRQAITGLATIPAACEYVLTYSTSDLLAIRPVTATRVLALPSLRRNRTRRQQWGRYSIW